MGDQEDERDVERLYRSEAPRLRRFFRVRLGRDADAGDLVQEAFVRLAGRRKQDTLRNGAAYLQRIARNMVVDCLRHAAGRPPLVPLDPMDAEMAVAADQTDALEAAELMEAYEAAVGALPARTREVFLLHRVAGLRYGEIADRLTISVRTVEWHIAEALLRIRRALDQR